MAQTPDSNLRSLQTSFSAGELDPLMRMRSDLKTYFKGGRKARNVAIYAQGGVRRRPGTIYKYNLGELSVLHPYSYTEGQEYVLAFQNTQVRIFDNTGALLTTVTSAPWTTAILKELTISASADTIIICHKSFMPQKLLRTGASSFTLSDFAFEESSTGVPRRQPYFKFVADSITLTPSATTGSITLTASSAVFTADHVGTLFRLDHGGGYKEVEITGFTSSTLVDATVRETLGGTSAVNDWQEQTFSDVRGYPRCVTFHDQRLYFAGTTSRPDGFFGSKASAFFNFDVDDATDEDAIDVTVASDEVSEIRHLVATRNIQIFTDGGELYVPQSVTAAINPNNIRFIPQTPYGTGQKANPVKFDGATLFLQKTGRVIREYLWNDTEQAYSSNPVSIVSNHLISGVDDTSTLLGTNERPEQYAFFVNSDGTMAVFTSVRNEEVAGWVQWNTNGSFVSTATAANNLFACVSREIDSTTVYWLEMFDWDVTMDAVKQDTGAAKTSWTAAHLPNSTVKTTTNSNAQYLGEYTTNGSGEITTDEAVDDIEIGLDFTFELETMPVDAVIGGQYITGEKKRISRVVASVYGTQSMSLANNELVLTQAGQDFSNPPTPAEGEYQFFLLGWSGDPTVSITQTVPLPLSVRGLYMEVTA